MVPHSSLIPVLVRYRQEGQGSRPAWLHGMPMGWASTLPLQTLSKCITKYKEELKCSLEIPKGPLFYNLKTKILKF